MRNKHERENESETICTVKCSFWFFGYSCANIYSHLKAKHRILPRWRWLCFSFRFFFLFLLILRRKCWFRLSRTLSILKLTFEFNRIYFIGPMTIAISHELIKIIWWRESTVSSVLFRASLRTNITNGWK